MSTVPPDPPPGQRPAAPVCPHCGLGRHPATTCLVVSLFVRAHLPHRPRGRSVGPALAEYADRQLAAGVPFPPGTKLFRLLIPVRPSAGPASRSAGPGAST